MIWESDANIYNYTVQIITLATLFTCKNERPPFTCNCQTNYIKFNCWRDCVSFTWKLIRRCHNQFTWYKLELTCMCNISFYFLQGNILQQILSVEFLLELVNTVPFVITVSITRIYIYIEVYKWIFHLWWWFK